MQILHVLNTLDPAAGGPPVVATRLAAAQAQLGHTVGITAYRCPAAAITTDRFLQGIPHRDLLDIHEFNRPERLEWIPAFRARRPLRQLIGQADVVHIHGVWELIVKFSSDLARAAGVPFVITPHGMLDPWALRQTRYKRLKKWTAFTLGYRTMLRHARFLHALNADERDRMAPLSLGAPVRVIPNGVFLEEFERTPPAGTFRAAHPELGDAPFVLFLSRLHYKKGLDYLGEAFAKVAGADAAVRLVVAGPDGGAEQPFREQIARLGITDRVHLVGPLYETDKLAALRDAAVFCLPSRAEGFSIAITEALAASLPVVVSDQCHFPEVAEVDAGEVVPLDADATADALLRVLHDPNRIARGRAGRALVETRFTWPRVAEQMAAAYGGA